MIAHKMNYIWAQIEQGSEVIPKYTFEQNDPSERKQLDQQLALSVRTGTRANTKRAGFMPVP